MERPILQTGEIYHVYNRGVDKRVVFSEEDDYWRFLKMLVEFNNDLDYFQRDYLVRRYDLKSETYGKLNFRYLKFNFGQEPSSFNQPILDKDLQLFELAVTNLIEIQAFCLMPTHFHLILRQLIANGISKFMQKLSTGYTNYFNLKNNRTGSLFQGRFKPVQMESDEHLLKALAYVNGNPSIHGLADFAVYRWSSFNEYFSRFDKVITNPSLVEQEFKNKTAFVQFVSQFSANSRKRKLEKEFIK